MSGIRSTMPQSKKLSMKQLAAKTLLKLSCQRSNTPKQGTPSTPGMCPNVIMTVKSTSCKLTATCASSQTGTQGSSRCSTIVTQVRILSSQCSHADTPYSIRKIQTPSTLLTRVHLSSWSPFLLKAGEKMVTQRLKRSQPSKTKTKSLSLSKVQCLLHHSSSALVS